MRYLDIITDNNNFATKKYVDDTIAGLEMAVLQLMEDLVQLLSEIVVNNNLILF